MDDLETKTRKQEYTPFQKVRATSSDGFKLISNITLWGTVPGVIASLIALPSLYNNDYESLSFGLPLVVGFGGSLIHQVSGILAEIIGPRGHYEHIIPPPY